MTEAGPTLTTPSLWEPPANLRFAGVAWRAVAFLIDALVIGVYGTRPPALRAGGYSLL